MTASRPDPPRTDEPVIPDGDPVLLGAFLLLAAVGYALRSGKREGE